MGLRSWAFVHLAAGAHALAPSVLPLRIDGVWYDAAPHADAHFGGRWLLEYSRGRDVTALFYATHLWGEERAAATLAKLPRITESDLAAEQQGPHVVDRRRAPSHAPAELPPIQSPLRAELQAMLRRRFPTVASMKATRAHWARTGVAALLCLACWVGWLHLDPLAVLLLPPTQWVLAAHTVHEATHGALSTDPRINYLAQFTAHPILFNVYVWIPQHLLSHHQYTNDPDHDADLHHFAPARLADAVGPYADAAEGAPNRAWTFVWKGCLTTLGTCILQPLRTLSEKPTPNFDVNITPVPAAVSKRTLAISMLPSLFVLVYPLFAAATGVASPLACLFALIWPWVGMSLIWTAMTQTSHVQAACQPEDAPGCWTARQIGTALDYSVGDPLATALTAGLNAQGLHHAMPTLSCAHFPEVYHEYEAICARHGVRPRQTRNLISAVKNMFAYIFELNAPQPQQHVTGAYPKTSNATINEIGITM